MKKSMSPVHRFELSNPLIHFTAVPGNIRFGFPLFLNGIFHKGTNICFFIYFFMLRELNMYLFLTKPESPQRYPIQNTILHRTSLIFSVDTLRMNSTGSYKKFKPL